MSRQFTRLITTKGEGEEAATRTTAAARSTVEAGTSQEELTAELDKLLEDWLDREEVDQAIEQAVTNVILVSRAPLRFLIPPGRLDEDGKLTVSTPAEALENVFLTAPKPEAATVYVDTATQEKAGLFGYEEEGRRLIEISYRNDEDQTTIRILGEPASESPEQSIALAGRPTIYEIRRARYVTEQIRQQQKLYNLAATMMGRNIELAGYREVTILNADLAGSMVDDGRGGRRFVPDPLPVGAGQLLSLRGITTEDADGMERITQPGIQYADPVSVQTFVDTQAAAYTAALEEAHQLHYLISGDATASGVSREAAQADHIVSLAQTKKAVDRALTWILTTAVAYTEALINQPGRYTATLEIKASARLYAGPVSQSMIQTIASVYRDGLLSAETALEMIGIENIREELERLSTERPDSLQQLGEVEQSLREILEQRNAQDGTSQAGQTQTAPTEISAALGSLAGLA